jgi:hypothetical protein
MVRRLMLVLALVLAPLWLLGCGGTNNKAAKNGGKTEEHAHEHPAEGPHHGHLVELAEPGKENKEEYHVEWSHDESGKITVWILDGKGTKTVSIAAETVVIKVKTGDKTDSFELAAVDRTSGEQPTAFKFEVVSKELEGKLETIGETVLATVHVDVNGKAYEGKFETHEEHAGHKH